MFFSLIVPIYNTENYLPTCIESVLGQSFNNYELILVNDGSTDNSGFICDKYAEKDNRIKVIHKENGGVSSARNRGIKEAQGDYVIFLDSDDTLVSNSLEIINNELSKGQVDILFCNYDRKYKGETTTIKADVIVQYKNDDKEIIDKIISLGVINTCCSKVYRLDFIKKHNVYFSNLIYGEDFDWVLELLLRNPNIRYCDISIITYRRREDSITNVLKIEKEYNKIRFCKKWYQKLSKTKNIINCLSWLYLSAIFNYYKYSKSDRLKLKQAFDINFQCLKQASAAKVKVAIILIKILGYNLFSRFYNFLKFIFKRKVKYE